jgi:uncharacterized phage-associated protein
MSTGQTTNAHDVAAAVIELCGEVDALKLQKLVFIAAGEYLAMTGQTMFDQPIEAWDYGPVIHTIYATYKKTEGKEPIRTPLKGRSGTLNDCARGCVESVVERLGNLTGPQLIQLTHEMEPWQDAYVAGQYRTPIESQAIYNYFAKAPTTQQAAEAVSAWNAARRTVHSAA